MISSGETEPGALADRHRGDPGRPGRTTPGGPKGAEHQNRIENTPGRSRTHQNSPERTQEHQGHSLNHSELKTAAAPSKTKGKRAEIEKHCKNQGKTRGAGEHLGAASPSDWNNTVSRTHPQHRNSLISRLDSLPQPPMLINFHGTQTST